MIKVTRKMINGNMIFTSWEDDKWCAVAGLSIEKQTPEEIEALIVSMKLRAQRPGAPRNGKRTAVKC